MRYSLAGHDWKLAPCLALVLALPLTDSAFAQQATPAPAAQAQTNAPPAALPENSSPPVPQSVPSSAQAPAPGRQAPVGAAAAPVIRSAGVPASEPAGAAIAPAKQRRTRSYAIRVGLIVGAAIAVGTVTAASLSTSSRPH